MTDSANGPGSRGRRVLVVGATSGIGLATARRFAAAGDRLTLVARDESALAVAAKSCLDAGAIDVRTAAADVADADQIGAVVEGAVTAYGGIDVTVHTATVMGYGRIENVPAADFLAVVDVAIHGTLHLAQALLPVLRRQRRGTFVVVNSLLGSVTVPNMGPYSTAKWGQRALVRTLQQETRDEPGISISLVSPGSLNTPIYYQAANYMGRDARPPVPVLQPERAAAVILRLVDRPRRDVSVPVGPGNPVVIAGYRLLPWLYDLLVGPLFRLAAMTGRERAPTSGNVHRAVGEQDALHGRWPDDRG
ncbi:Short-chain dehydrogenase [Jatrophihabitans endophyticus]|uniref:Short-chain dehydrogenase n=1 Tax=Jatrophihabitans endophyticus TaxID=1206085 RepID=A0A1M5DVS4_9ACTN|nr:SDR family NAD(P)-dependent oxidoreductase [Jatrophihabitans endophyticus]SHF71049.1 Short-chain dehydrogenase [Jatrophihabitans endophyticus]